jgi:hypothetical protein
MNNWACAYSTTQLYLAHIVKDLLEDNGFDAVILNQQDSAYINIGQIEVLVHPDNLIKAKHLIKKSEI